MTKKTKEKPMTKKVEVLEHDKWLYNKEGAKLFKEGDEVPEGYKDTPVKAD